MGTLTARLKLTKPATTDTEDVGVINANMDILDGVIGVDFVTHLADIAVPIEGQFAYDNTLRRLFFYTQGAWLLVAAGDFNSGNPNRIRLPDGSLSSMGDTTNAFQIGPDSGANIAMDSNDLQGRNNGAAATLRLNFLGGDVKIGDGGTPAVASKDGFNSPAMASGEASDATNIVGVNATSWTAQAPGVTLGAIKAPPSGKFHLILSADIEGLSGGTDPPIQISVDCHRNSNGNQVFAPGGASRSLYADHCRVSSSVSDIITGLVAGENYNFTIFGQKGAGAGTNPNIYFRKVLVIPII